MNNLKDKLRKETESLKNIYLESTRKWSINNYKYIIQRQTWTEETWCSFLGIKPELKIGGGKSDYYSFPKGFYGTSNSKKYVKLKNELNSLLRLGEEKYLEKQLKNAENHYESSLNKLIKRIELKNLDVEKLKIVSGYVGQNLEMTLSDGDKIVKAFTIFAEGFIQRPHYRYLVK